MIDIREKHEKCWHCENFYGPSQYEPICSTCHYFLFSVPDEQSFQKEEKLTNKNKEEPKNELDSSATNSVNIENNDSYSNIEVSSNLFASSQPNSSNRFRNIDEKLELYDSGNEDSDQIDYTAYNIPQDEESNDAGEVVRFIKSNNSNWAINNNNHITSNNNINNNNNNNNRLKSKLRNHFFDPKSYQSIFLKNRIQELSEVDTRNFKHVSYDLIETLPSEILLGIFKNLDDLSLWSASLVCKRWHQLIKQEINDDQWKEFIEKRFILFKPTKKIESYRNVYSQLVQSSNCFYCLNLIHKRNKCISNLELKKTWRHRRLLLELKAMQLEPLDGITAKPLDEFYFFWQASIVGPPDSPYEGGIFYLYLHIPKNYPLSPPLVRFITKIYHPNVSKHGDIGLDSIQDNWSLALTISKVLISIQSLLTDPYTFICMDAKIGYLYEKNRKKYEENARNYTSKYAMTDFVSKIID